MCEIDSRMSTTLREARLRPGNYGSLRYNQHTRWLQRLIAVALAFQFVLLAGSPARTAENKSGIAPHVLSLPSGPGSIAGLGDAFEPRLNSGAASYRLAFDLPPGRGGFAPEIVLEYHSGNPNGTLGVGWQLNIPFVQRQTEKGLPHYTLWPVGDGRDNDNDGEVDEADEFDTVIYYSKEELVPVADGYWRFENESEFVRFRKTNVGWLATRRDGVGLEFGRADSSRVGSTRSVFRWHLDRMTDLNGNVINFEYEKLDDSAQIYLKRIVYNQTKSAAMEVRFKHELRPDVIADFRPRFELKTAYRCTEVTVLVGGQLVRSYRLGYAATSAWRPLSLLASVTEVGRDGVSSLPPTRFGYTGANRTASVAQLLDRAPFIDLNDPNIDLLDLNADGLPDIIEHEPTATRLLPERRRGRHRPSSLGERCADGQPRWSVSRRERCAFRRHERRRTHRSLESLCAYSPLLFEYSSGDLAERNPNSGRTVWIQRSHCEAAGRRSR